MKKTAYVFFAALAVLSLAGPARAVQPYCADDDFGCEDGLRRLREHFGGKSGHESFDGAAKARRDGPVEILDEQQGIVLRTEEIERCRHRGGREGDTTCVTDPNHVREVIGDRQTVKIVDREGYVKEKQAAGMKTGGLIGGGVGLLLGLLLMGPLGLAAAAVGLGAAGAGVGIGAAVGKSNGESQPETFVREIEKDSRVVDKQSVS